MDQFLTASILFFSNSSLSNAFLVFQNQRGALRFYLMKPRHLLIALLAAPFAACVPPPPLSTDSGAVPVAYKAIMKEYIKENYFDPYSMRDVEISPPQAGHMGQYYGYLVCVKANAKNRSGGYTGLSRNAYLIRSNVVILSEANSAYCSRATYAKWPEMEGR